MFSDDRAHLTSDKDAVVNAVQILQDINLAATSGDVKGAAYEELIKDTFEKSENQQFFTPRVIVEFMVEFADPSPNMVMCDPACGSGGFLIAALQHVFTRIDQENESEQRKTAQKRIFKGRHLVGAEIDRRMAWVAQMNLLMHGDGEGSVFYLPDGGSLAYTEAARTALPENHFDLILTNPPFGSDFSDPAHLARYETGKGRTSRRRGVLFVERCLRMLKPNGLFGIILDDSVLSGPANQDVRHLIFREAVVEAVISLPDVAFMPYATAKASILFIRKKPPLPPLEMQRQLLATFKKSWNRYLACRKRSQEALREADESLEEAYQLVQATLCPSLLFASSTACGNTCVLK